MDIQGHIEAIQQALTNADKALSDKETHLNLLSVRIEEAKLEYNNLQAGVENKKASIEAEIAELDEKAEPLRNEVMILKGDVERLVQEKTALMTQNARLENVNKDLKAYEARAWKVLEAKDNELQERETKISQREQLTGGRTSFLPPTKE